MIDRIDIHCFLGFRMIEKLQLKKWIFPIFSDSGGQVKGRTNDFPTNKNIGDFRLGVYDDLYLLLQI